VETLKLEIFQITNIIAKKTMTARATPGEQVMLISPKKVIVI
jgi:hypothetical protein